EGCFLYQFAARAVDDAHALLHRCDGLGVDDAVGLRSEAHMQREVIGSGEQLLERDQADAVLSRDSRRDERIAAYDFKPESAGALGYLNADAAQPDDAERLAL